MQGREEKEMNEIGITNEMIEKIGDRMAVLINVRNLCHSGEPNKFDWELSGMQQLLKGMEIPFKYEFSDTAQDYLQIQTLIIAGQRFECEVRED